MELALRAYFIISGAMAVLAFIVVLYEMIRDRDLDFMAIFIAVVLMWLFGPCFLIMWALGRVQDMINNRK